MTRPHGFTVALLGADGAGKSTLAKMLTARLPFPTTSAYLGDAPPNGVSLLPTTRWLRRRWADSSSAEASAPESVGQLGPGRSRRLVPAGARSAATSMGTTLLLMAEELHQVRRARRLVQRGYVVVLDRHYYYDYYWHDIRPPQQRTLRQRLHGAWLSHVLARPDLVVFLDAAAEVLFARKPEGTIDARRRRCLEYRCMAEAGGLLVIDVSRPLDQVTDELARQVIAFARTRDAARTCPQS